MADDEEREGRITRSLFHTDSDSSDDYQQEGEIDNVEKEHETTWVERQAVMHVVVEQRRLGGSIAERLWPAAEYLANFLLGQQTLDSHRPDEKPLLADLRALLATEGLPVVELGAGIGLTGLEMATQFPVKVLLTDLDAGLQLLKRNAEINQGRFRLGPHCIAVQRLEWSNKEDAKLALTWYRSQQSESPLLVLGSDCVYWEELHAPLESTLATILSSAPPGSTCLLAGMRRWKRDNAFYQTLGKRTRTATHQLRCECLDEQVTRTEQGKREILRVYAVQWVVR